MSKIRIPNYTLKEELINSKSNYVPPPPDVTIWIFYRIKLFTKFDSDTCLLFSRIVF